MTRTPIFRLVAVFLLLLTGVELFACEVLAPGQCESFGLPSDQQSGQSDDNCICCCTHILVANLPLLDVAPGTVGTLEPEHPLKAERQPTSIYHPPRV